MTVWVAREGDQGPMVLLLHGLGATGAVWNGTVARLHERERVITVVVDLPGHGSSAWQPPYSVGGMAAAVTPLVHDAGLLHVIGHSLGVYVGLALASSWFNCTVASVTGIGPKVTWSDADFARMRELAQRPARFHPTATEALERYRRASGLDVAIAPDVAILDRGTVATPEGHRLAADPATFAVGAPSFAGLLGLVRCPVVLARGEHDGMVSAAELRDCLPGAVELPGLGHNAHVESPAAIVGLFDAVRMQASHRE